MKHCVTYGQLHQLLLDLGFQDHSGEHLMYVHPEQANGLLRLAFHEGHELMLARDVVKVRALLDLSGIMERDEFERWTRDRKPHKAALG